PQMILNRSVANEVRAPFRRVVDFSRLGAAVAALVPALAMTFVAAFASPAQAEKLPLERLFSAPDLSGASMRGVKISPDGKLVAYLRARADDKDRFDLWAYDVSQS